MYNGSTLRAIPYKRRTLQAAEVLQQMKVWRMHDAAIDQKQLGEVYRNGDDW